MDASKVENWSTIPEDGHFDKASRKGKRKEKGVELTILDYQDNDFQAAIKYVNNFRIGIDGGANYGLVSYKMAKLFESVHAFELIDTVCDHLKINVQNFELNNVVVHNTGLGEVNEDVTVRFNPLRSFSSQVVAEDSKRRSEKSARTVTLDSFNLENVDFIKLDTEGYEGFIFRGAKETIARCKPVIYFENKGKDVIWDENISPVDQLKEYGYKMVEDFGKDCVMVYDGK